MIHLKEILRSRVDEAYLIGSYAEGSADDMSDVDLILICNTKKAWPDRGDEFNDLWNSLVELDLLIYTPEEWKILQENSTPFLVHAQEQWKKIV